VHSVSQVDGKLFSLHEARVVSDFRISSLKVGMCVAAFRNAHFRPMQLPRLSADTMHSGHKPKWKRRSSQLLLCLKRKTQICFHGS
jgi:hypothetical protein